MHVTHWTKDRPHDDDLFEPFERVVSELQNRTEETSAPATIHGIHPEFGEMVAIRTAHGAVVISERPFIHFLAG